MMMMLYLIKLSLLPAYLWDMLWAPIYKRAMAHCGKNVYLRPMSSDLKGLHNISIGEGTSIPKGAVFYCTDAPLTIGKKVVFGPKPTIITGDHVTDVIGKHIIDVQKSYSYSPDMEGVSYDLPVVIEDGCWIGANVTILKGVTIGRGSVVAAGAVVTKSCPPYSIIGGVPAKLLRMRFTPEQIAEHERLLEK